MGYNTKFKGELKFTTELNASHLAKLKTFFGEDPDKHMEWLSDFSKKALDESNFSYINLEFTDNFDGIRWNGGEKTYFMENSINLIIKEMKKMIPEFGLTGEMYAQGEDVEDRWILKIKDGIAIVESIQVLGKRIQCPYCETTFMSED